MNSILKKKKKNSVSSYLSETHLDLTVVPGLKSKTRGKGPYGAAGHYLLDRLAVSLKAIEVVPSTFYKTKRRNQ
ncbi:Hypothetical predicted protein [Olea europaea subsp. europaea]|uniref:Uncharacterized protein n=1 Tax=Olea europaea subsp. europaea TaxID=158383 RepID=A0A8S0VHC4_OLEEU|nr:Hypothetical predicted protein [Olea europaea subsp. europaea]